MIRFSVSAMFATVLIGSSLLLDGQAANGQERQTAAKGEAAKVRELLKERLEILRDVAKQLTEAYKHGTAPFGRVSQANLAVLRAELELCESHPERLGIHEKIVKAARDREGQALQLAKSGTVPGYSVLEARLARLDAEIAWERAKEKSLGAK